MTPKEEQKHTDLPYSFSKMDNGYGFCIYGNSGKRVIGPISAHGAGISGCSKKAKDTAAFIVEACNSYYTRKADCHEELAWLDISAAPKDGTWIIGAELNEYGKWARYITYYTASIPWSDHWLYDHDEESEYCPAGWFKESSDDEIVNSCKPTHWMPLHAAPIARATNHQEKA